MGNRTFAHKRLIDPLDIANYFWRTSDPSGCRRFLGVKLLRKAIATGTMNRGYAARIAERYAVPQAQLPPLTETEALHALQVFYQRLPPLTGEWRGLPQAYPGIKLFTARQLPLVPEECRSFFLLNGEQLALLALAGLLNLHKFSFAVVPSYGLDGCLNNLGFRTMDDEFARTCSKWIFPMGQQATFGLHEAKDQSEPILLVEGAWDQRAMAACGYRNAVGLGSRWVSPEHLAQLPRDREYALLLDSDFTGTREEALAIVNGLPNILGVYVVTNGKDPYEAWQRQGTVEIAHITE